MDIQTIREERAKLQAEARKIIDAADAEKRGLSNEENSKYDLLMGEFDKHGDELNKLEKRAAVEAAEKELNKSYRKVSPDRLAPADKLNPGEAIRSWLCRSSTHGMSHEQLENAARCGVDFNSPALKMGTRAFSKSSDGSGLVQWTEFTSAFDKALKFYGSTRNHVNVVKTASGQTLPWAKFDDSTSGTRNIAAIVAEATAVDEVKPTTGYTNIGAYKYTSGEVAISLELLRDSAVDVESLVVEAIYERFARAFEAHIVAGTGSSQPYGLQARATSSGVVLGGTGAAPTITTDDLLDLIESVDLAYQSSPDFGILMSPALFAKCRKLKDSTGQPIWQVDYRSGAPGTIFGVPVYRTASLPSTGVNAKAILAGDMKRYVWREVGEIEMYRLDQVRMLSGMVSFVAFMRASGDLPNTSAVKYAALAAS